MWIFNARILAVVMVVLGHSFVNELEKSVVGSSVWWIECAIVVMRRWSVPLFVMVSGSLLLPKSEPFGVFYRKRAMRVVVPMLFWSVVYTAWTAIRQIAHPDGQGLSVLWRNLLGGVPYYHLWYLYMLVFLYLFTPFLRMVVAASTRRQLWFLVVAGFCIACSTHLYAVVMGVQPGFFAPGFLSFLPYFVLGHLLSTSRREFPAPLLAGVFVLGAASGTVGAYLASVHSGAAGASYFFSFLALPVVAMATSLLQLLRRWNRPFLGESVARFLGTSTFGIYLVHAGVLDVFHYLASRAGLQNPLAMGAFLTVSTTLASLAVVAVFRRTPLLRSVV